MTDRLPFSSLSVIIPTYNREKVLAKALHGYLAQSSPQLIHELIVVDDGSTDTTESMVSNVSKQSVFPIRYLRQSNKGPAAARNFGIREARSDLVLFTDSDVIPERDLVEQHIIRHQKDPRVETAVQGYLAWAPSVNPTPFMRWYGENQLFSFRELQNKRGADFRCFYTCNLSLKTEFLRTCGQFDEQFKTAAYEDTELGYRLSKQGLHLVYSSAAIGYHDQFFSFEDACRKALANAPATRLFLRTEAGREASRLIQTKESRPGYAFGARVATVVARTLFPFRGFLDSSIPLPGIVYHLFFWFSMQNAADENGPSPRQ